MIVCAEATKAKAMAMADDIRAAVTADSIRVNDRATLSVTVSVGVAAYDSDPDYQRLIARADKALYEAKNSGRKICTLAA